MKPKLTAMATRRPTSARQMAIMERVLYLDRLTAKRRCRCRSPFGVGVFSGVISCCWGDLRSPRSSSSQVMSKISAITGITERSGAPSSRSQRLMVLSETLSRSASSFWVMPLAFRKAAIKPPMVFFSMGILLGSVMMASFYRFAGENTTQQTRKSLSECENFSFSGTNGPKRPPKRPAFLPGP